MPVSGCSKPEHRCLFRRSSSASASSCSAVEPNMARSAYLRTSDTSWSSLSKVSSSNKGFSGTESFSFSSDEFEFDSSTDMANAYQWGRLPPEMSSTRPSGFYVCFSCGYCKPAAPDLPHQHSKSCDGRHPTHPSLRSRRARRPTEPEAPH